MGSLLRSLGVSKVESGIEPMAVEGLANNPYAIANTRVDCVLKNTHIPVSFWRSVGSSHNAFIIESFVDELAHAGGQDPYQFRRKLLAGKPDWIKVLDTAAEKGDWGKPLPKGKGRGIAIHECFGSIVGIVAEVAIVKGQVKVERATLAVDCGHAVNPRTVAEQMAGGLIYGLTAALYGKMTVKDGAIVEGQFRHLSDGAHGRRAEDRRAFRLERRRQVGRRRRARHRAHRARRGQRDLRRHRQAHPPAAVPRHRPVRSGVSGAHRYEPPSLRGGGGFF